MRKKNYIAFLPMVGRCGLVNGKISGKKPALNLHLAILTSIPSSITLLKNLLAILLSARSGTNLKLLPMNLVKKDMNDLITAGELVVSPMLDPEQVGDMTIDFRLGTDFLVA